MRELPRNIDADVVLALGHLLDDLARMTSVSLADAIAEVRRAVRTNLANDDIEVLVVEMACSRGLAVTLDRRVAGS
jgi:hypothetical protein